MAKKTVESRAEGYKQAWGRYLELVDEAEAKGDLKGLRRNLEHAIQAWLNYTECAASPAIRESREETLAKHLDWLESLPDDPADLPQRGRKGDEQGPGKRKAAEGRAKDEDGPDYVPVERPTIRFDDLAGLEDVKEEIRLKMIYPFQHPEQAERYKIRRGGGILLYGPPGTGKTLMARAVAGEIDAAFFTVKPSEIMSKWVGDSEQNIQRLFAAARSHERSIVFIDEIEALVPARRDVQAGVMSRLVPQILAELEGFDTSEKNPILFIGATNEPWSLDPAVLRPGRFDEKVYVGLPDADARAEIFRICLKERPLADDVDLAALAALTEGFSGADIKNVCEKSAAELFLRAVRDGGESAPIARADLERVITAAQPSVSRSNLERFQTYRKGRTEFDAEANKDS